MIEPQVPNNDEERWEKKKGGEATRGWGGGRRDTHKERDREERGEVYARVNFRFVLIKVTYVALPNFSQSPVAA